MFLERSLTVCLCICQSNWPTSSWGFSCLYPPLHQRMLGVQRHVTTSSFDRSSGDSNSGPHPWVVRSHRPGPNEEILKGFWFGRERGAKSRQSQQPHVSVIAKFRSSCEGSLGKAQTLLVLGIWVQAQRDKAMTAATGASTRPWRLHV